MENFLASGIWCHLRRSATEAQFGLESEHELEFALESEFEFAFELESETEFEFALKGEVEIGVAYELRFESELVLGVEFEFEKHDLRKALMGGSTLKNALRGTPGGYSFMEAILHMAVGTGHILRILSAPRGMVILHEAPGISFFLPKAL